MPRGLTFTRLADLAHPIGSGMPRWPGDPPVTFLDVASREEDGYDLRVFAMGEHSGTHVNAPLSFLPGGADVRAAAPWPLLLPPAMLDLCDRAAADPGVRCTPDDVLAREATHGRVPRGCLFVCNTGWHRLWSAPDRFMGVQWGALRAGPGDAPPMVFPSFTTDAVHLLVHERGAAGIGIDTHGVDAPDDAEFLCNRMALSAGAVVVECLAALDGLPATGAHVLLAPLGLCGGTGAPVSVTAFIS
ncbi:cyclase family protein [Nitratidesulfovibrio liaohensis]|uniref:Cyclase family protein n=1 Tax=Nitratidesulfovibrio liaohensis TaxID=2604158 RepID=A0ABY9R685_9BACT|nr:cyclase family protein [Nitratidesulfovibrio liaohensis]WMW66135.1 cyclase family protein [Nitratidesulfovibrio liaohensis]